MRYKLDAVFRAYNRAKSHGHRRRDKQLTDDTIKPRAIRALLQEVTECLYCGCELDADTVVFDHMHPRALGGAHSIHNLAPSCSSCNYAKGATPMQDWLATLDASAVERVQGFTQRDDIAWQMQLW